ncbi:hypothetical protein KPRYC492_13265 [Klebsiella pneumoniae RYC492]|nr:hypothetical protein KPRYC492_13265 [Klebsiella pneumoniae RYC492]
MMAKNDEVRQNLIPLNKQYQTLAAAQADIANIPVGSTTYTALLCTRMSRLVCLSSTSISWSVR